MTTNAAIRKQVTAQIMEAIEKNNVLPWRRPWRRSPNTGRAINVVSKKSYNGINPPLAMNMCLIPVRNLFYNRRKDVQ